MALDRLSQVTSSGISSTVNFRAQGITVSGVVTATSFVGDGSGLTGVVGSGSGVIVRDDGTLVGTAGTINFGSNLSVSAVSAGIVTVTGTDTNTTYTQAAVADGSNVNLRLTGSDSTTDDILLTAGTNITFSSVTAGGLTISASGGSGSIAGIDTSGTSTFTNLNVTGVSTFAGITTVTGPTLFVKQLNASGVVTASSFSGSASGLTGIPAGQLTGALPALDGSALTGVVGSGSGVIVRDSGTLVGTAGTIDFGDNLTVSAVVAGIVTVTASGGGSIAGINTSGTSTFNNLNVTGVTTSTGGFVGNVTGNATGLSGTPNITVGTIGATSLNASGVVTATSFSGSGINLTGIVTSIASGSGISIDQSTGKVTITATGGSGSIAGISTAGTSTFNNLNVTGVSTVGVVTGATYFGDGSRIVSGRWTLGASAYNNGYTFTGIGFTETTEDPILYLERGAVYEFVNNMGAHPFRIQSTPNGSTGTQYDNGVTNNNVSNGTLRFEVPFNAPSILYYQCTAHSNMGGIINILDGINLSQLNVTGVSTLGNTVVGGGTTQLIVTGDARITGILTIGTGSITLDGSNNQLKVGTGVTITTNGIVGITSINSGQLGGSRNLIINGAMVVDQRNVGTATTVNGDGFGNRKFPVDKFSVQRNGTVVITAQQDIVAPPDFQNSVKLTVTTADSSVAAADYAIFGYRLEGYSAAPLRYGTSDAKQATLSFWVRSSVTGTYCISITNYADNRSQVKEYTINSANTWEYKTITITGDTTGTWEKTTSGGMNIQWTLLSGSDYQNTANTWHSAVELATSNQTQWGSTTSATFYLTGVQLEIGTVGTSFEHRDYGDELARCQRYYQHQVPTWGTPRSSDNYIHSMGFFKVTMRISPVLTQAYNTYGQTIVIQTSNADYYVTGATSSAGSSLNAGYNASAEL